MRAIFGLAGGATADALGATMTRMLELLMSPAAIVFPFAVPGTPFHELLGICDRFESLLRPLIEEKRRLPPGQRDVLALLLRAQDEDGSGLTDDEVVGHMTTLFAAGYDTTAQTLVWTLLLLAHRPDVLGDLVDEVSGVLRGGAPGVEHVGRMLLLDRVLKESMRLLPATPMLHIRVCADQAALGPYLLPLGANVILSPLVTHRDPTLYPEPARFRPERWDRLTPSLYEYIPFGAGPRMCIGAAFATLSLRLMLPMILSRFRLRLVDGANVSRRMGGIIMGTKHGMPMFIAPQDRWFTRPSRIRGDIHEVCDLT
jgi:cytochrome P450